jgi:hypothetical protein
MAGVLPHGSGGRSSSLQQRILENRARTLYGKTEGRTCTLVEHGETVPAGEKSDWLHPIKVTPKKDGSFRLCVNLRMLNKFVKRPENPQRSPWEVVRTIPIGCRHFATLDAFKGYHQVELDPESRKLTTFHTPFGRYQYACLSMGLSAPAKSSLPGKAMPLITQLKTGGAQKTLLFTVTPPTNLPERQESSSQLAPRPASL